VFLLCRPQIGPVPVYANVDNLTKFVALKRCYNILRTDIGSQIP
jgi:hypothetical protein